MLERGGFVPREIENWDTKAVNLDARYNTNETWRDRDGQALHPHTNYFVGGNTKFYGAALFRLRREDFGEIKHHGGVSPAWPIAYDDLEPYYPPPSGSTRCTASAAWILRIRPRAAPTPTRR